jgi:hypothetical protein
VRLFLLIVAILGCAHAAQEDERDDATKLLLEARKQILHTVSNLPRYLCTETIDRVTSHPVPEVVVLQRSCGTLASRKRERDWHLRRTSSDRLRLDVAESNGGEMFSWMGENHFRDQSLAELVHSGATATGSFSDSLGGIFTGNAATFTYNGDVETNGRLLAEFSYSVPLAKSNYSIGNKSRHYTVPYHGTFLVDPNSFELMQLTVQPSDLPDDLRICESTSTLEYGNMRVNGSDFLIPKSVHWHLLYLDSTEADSTTVFSSCHEFLGESTLNFGDVAPGAATDSPLRTRQFQLPPRLGFAAATTSPIETATAAAGDRIRARLISTIKHDRKTLVPKGTILSGRIVHIERIYGPVSDSLMVAIKLSAIEVNGEMYPFAAQLNRVMTRFRKRAGKNDARQLGSFDQMIDPTEDTAVGVFRFQDVPANWVIRAGLVIEGKTAAPK